ncbi:hypothetical protein M011DRAFT_348856 [Sporormia fimetaria CBS 119925]|uniref:Uncharacterized protein n=1 Tax=Sporormia fimetaria CBS 119925 TaxID=1340428 RepID=A0A6A6VFT4_9PLEO|nr:hypothetical protein M011DRAFT_348856 [Sporormia fimetaria CBS 119925]
MGHVILRVVCTLALKTSPSPSAPYIAIMSLSVRRYLAQQNRRCQPRQYVRTPDLPERRTQHSNFRGHVVDNPFFAREKGQKHGVCLQVLWRAGMASSCCCHHIHRAMLRERLRNHRPVVSRQCFVFLTARCVMRGKLSCSHLPTERRTARLWIAPMWFRYCRSSRHQYLPRGSDSQIRGSMMPQLSRCDNCEGPVRCLAASRSKDPFQNMAACTPIGGRFH